MENTRDWSNAGGYGFWCGKKCVEKKQAAGIPPLGARKARKQQEVENDAILAQAALEKVRKVDEGSEWSPMAVAGVVGASFLGIAIMVLIIKKR